MVTYCLSVDFDFVLSRYSHFSLCMYTHFFLQYSPRICIVFLGKYLTHFEKEHYVHKDDAEINACFHFSCLLKE